MSEFCIIGNKYCDDAVKKQKRVRPFSTKTEEQLFCDLLLKDGREVKGVESRINFMSASCPLKNKFYFVVWGTNTVKKHYVRIPSKKKGVLWCGKSQSKKKT